MLVLVRRNIKNNKLLVSYYVSLAYIVHLLMFPLAGSFVYLILELVFQLIGIEIEIYHTFLIWTVVVVQSIGNFLVCYIVSKYLGNRLDKYLSPLSSSMRLRFSKHSLILSLLVAMLAIITIFAQGIENLLLVSLSNMSNLAIIFNTAVIMMASAFFSKHKQDEADFKTKAEKDLTDHTRQLEQAYNNMRGFRHDYRNLLSTLMGYDNMDELKFHLAKHLNYADKALEHLDSVEGRLNLINSPELRGLLWVKCAQAQTQGIDVELNLPEPIYDIPLPMEDLCRMVGIIMDNAIEELLGHDNKVLNLSIVPDEGDIIIDCSNPYKTAPLLKKIFDEGYSTKGPGRGIGLANLKKMRAENKNMSYTINMADGVFAIIIEIRRE